MEYITSYVSMFSLLLIYETRGNSLQLTLVHRCCYRGDRRQLTVEWGCCYHGYRGQMTVE